MWLLLVAFLCYATLVNGEGTEGTDTTRQEKAAGSRVVEAVVGLIQQSFIFKW